MFYKGYLLLINFTMVRVLMTTIIFYINSVIIGNLLLKCKLGKLSKNYKHFNFYKKLVLNSLQHITIKYFTVK